MTPPAADAWEGAPPLRAPARPRRRRHVHPIPGFRTSVGLTAGGLLVFVVVPVAALAATVASTPLVEVVRAVTEPRTVAALGLSVGAAALAAVASAPLGLGLAWTLARYELPGRRVLDALVDLPFALPTAVSGIALTALCAPTGWVGALAAPLGVQLAFSRVGIVVALVFTGLPFLVRTVMPVIEDLPVEVEEAAATLGASPWQTFRRVTFPAIAPALLAGTTLAFARGLGEYGSVVFIAGNMPMRTEIAPVRILAHLESYDYAGAAAVGLAMLLAGSALLLAVHAIERRLVRRGAPQA